LGLELVELVVALLLGVSLELDEEDPQAEKARTSPRTGTTVRFRRTRPMRALWLRRDRAVVDDKGVLPNGSWCACGSTIYPLKPALKRKLLGQRFQPTGPRPVPVTAIVSRRASRTVPSLHTRHFCASLAHSD